MQCRHCLWREWCGRAPLDRRSAECLVPHGLHCPKCRYKPGGHPPAAEPTREIYRLSLELRISPQNHCSCHSRYTGLPQTPLRPSVVSLSSSTVWSWTLSLADQRWRTHGSPTNNHYHYTRVKETLLVCANWKCWLKSSPVQGALGPTTCAFHRGCCWLHLLIYPESSHHRWHYPERSHCLEKQQCLVDIMLRSRHIFTITKTQQLFIIYCLVQPLTEYLPGLLLGPTLK